MVTSEGLLQFGVIEDRMEPDMGGLVRIVVRLTCSSVIFCGRSANQALLKLF